MKVVLRDDVDGVGRDPPLVERPDERPELVDTMEALVSGVCTTVIAEFSRHSFDESFTCVRIGGGSLGGAHGPAEGLLALRRRP